MRMRGIRFCTWWFLSSECQRSPALCFGAAVPVPQPLLPVSLMSPCIPDWSNLPWEAHVGSRHSQPHNVILADTQSAATRDPIWRWGKLQRTPVGKEQAQVFVIDSQETRYLKTLSVLHEPSTGTTQHTSMLCYDFFLLLETLGFFVLTV